MAKAIDIGTCFLVGAELRDGKEVYITERDAFFSMPNEDFAEEMLNRAGASYLTRGSTIYVVGEDALRFSLVSGNSAQLRRPMAKGVLNPGEEEAIAMLEVLIEAVVGRAEYQGEVIAATVPAPALDSDQTVTYHRMVIDRFLRSLGYDVKVLNEALALIYAENPTVEQDNQVVPFTGIGISFGAGMVNLVAAWRAKKLLEFSIGRGGDWIDRQVAQVRNLPVHKVTQDKEKMLDFTQNPANPTIHAVEIYTEDLIRNVMTRFAEEFKKTNASFEQPVEIILGGGITSAPGFVERFHQVIEGIELPMDVKAIRLASDPLKGVAAGALVAAISEERKKGNHPGVVTAQPKTRIYAGNNKNYAPNPRANAAPVKEEPRRIEAQAQAPAAPRHWSENDSAFSTAPREEVVRSTQEYQQEEESFTLRSPNNQQQNRERR